MENQLKKSAAYALILGCIFATFTMVVHPAGGSFEHLLRATKMLYITHSIAILSIPPMLFGFYGVYKSFNTTQNFSLFAFFTISVGLISIMIAGALDGLVLPMFINIYKDATPDKIETLKPILSYNFALNHAFDFIFIGSVCIAIIIWSILILKTKTYPAWLAYLGLLLTFGFLIGLAAGFNYVNVLGFRVFIFGFVGWIIAIGFLMLRSKSAK